MVDILVLNPPFLPKFSRPQRSPAVTKSGTLYFPLFLAQLVAVLEADGYRVDFCDAPAARPGLAGRGGPGRRGETVSGRARHLDPEH